MQDRFGAHPRVLVLASALTVFILLLAGCGGRNQPETPPTPTLVATLPAEIATLEPTAEPTTEPTAEPTAEATTEPTTEPTTEATVEPTAEPTVEATPEITATAEMTSGAAITATEEMTATEPMTSPETMTDTETITGTETVTDTGAMTETKPMTATDTVTASEGITAGESVTGTGAMTEAAMSPVQVFFLQPTDNAIIPITSTVVVSYTGEVRTPLSTNCICSSIRTSRPPGKKSPQTTSTSTLWRRVSRSSWSCRRAAICCACKLADSDHLALDGDQYQAEIMVDVIEGAPDQSVRIVSPTDGATVPPTFDVVMAATGLIVEPSGVVRPDAGHFHLLSIRTSRSRARPFPPTIRTSTSAKAELTTTLTLTRASMCSVCNSPTAHMRAGRRPIPRHDHRDRRRRRARRTGDVYRTGGRGCRRVAVPRRVGRGRADHRTCGPGRSVPKAGHLHLLINEDFAPPGVVIPADDTHIHFGKGQTSTELSLDPGEYTLRLQMANGAHMAQDGPQYEDEITVTVQ